MAASTSMNRTLAQEWQYARAWESEASRAAALDASLSQARAYCHSWASVRFMLVDAAIVGNFVGSVALGPLIRPTPSCACW